MQARLLQKYQKECLDFLEETEATPENATQLVKHLAFLSILLKLEATSSLVPESDPCDEVIRKIDKLLITENALPPHGLLSHFVLRRKPPSGRKLATVARTVSIGQLDFYDDYGARDAANRVRRVFFFETFGVAPLHYETGFRRVRRPLGDDGLGPSRAKVARPVSNVS